MFQLLLGLPYFLPALIRQVTSGRETDPRRILRYMIEA